MVPPHFIQESAQMSPYQRGLPVILSKLLIAHTPTLDHLTPHFLIFCQLSPLAICICSFGYYYESLPLECKLPGTGVLLNACLPLMLCP